MSTVTIEILLGKVHGITVTQADLRYRGSLTMDTTLMSAAGMMEYQKVLVVNNSNGERFETYLINGDKDSGVCCLNGATSYLGEEGHELIVMAFGFIDAFLARSYKPVRVFVDELNGIENIKRD
jgi:aspartate 1-decarboxylase